MITAGGVTGVERGLVVDCCFGVCVLPERVLFAQSNWVCGLTAFDCVGCGSCSAGCACVGRRVAYSLMHPVHRCTLFGTNEAQLGMKGDVSCHLTHEGKAASVTLCWHGCGAAHIADRCQRQLCQHVARCVQDMKNVAGLVEMHV